MLRPWPLLTLTLAISAAPVPGLADDAKVAQCEALKRAIERYDERRRGGGSAAQMDSWKRARQEKKDVFDRLKCRHILD